MKARLIAMIVCLVACVCGSTMSRAQNLGNLDSLSTPYEKAQYHLLSETCAAILVQLQEVDLYGSIGVLYAVTSALSECNTGFEEIDFYKDFIGDMFGLTYLIGQPQSYGDYVLKSRYKGLAEKFMSDSKVIDELMTDFDKERHLAREQQKEARRLEKERLEKLNKTSYYFLRRQIGEKFSIWAKKGEYEKTSEYNERLRKRAVAVLDSLCYHYVNNHFRQMIWSNEGHSMNYFGEYFALGNYNPDSETGTITYSANNYEEALATTKVSVTPEIASRLKGKNEIDGVEDYIRAETNRRKSTDLQVSVECLSFQVVNNELFPKSMVFRISGTQDQTVELTPGSGMVTEPMVFTTQSFSIQDSMLLTILNNYSFDNERYTMCRNRHMASFDSIAQVMIQNYKLSTKAIENLRGSGLLSQFQDELERFYSCSWANWSERDFCSLDSLRLKVRSTKTFDSINNCLNTNVIEAEEYVAFQIYHSWKKMIFSVEKGERSIVEDSSILVNNAWVEQLLYFNVHADRIKVTVLVDSQGNVVEARNGCVIRHEDTGKDYRKQSLNVGPQSKEWYNYYIYSLKFNSLEQGEAKKQKKREKIILNIRINELNEKQAHEFVQEIIKK